MKDFKILKILDKFKGIYKVLGIDYNTMRIILKTKLLMDGRKPATIFNNNKNEDDDSNKTFKNLMYYSFLGFFLVFLVVIKMNIMIQMTLYFGIIMFIIVTTFISDFSSVILDIRDKNIISTKGIDEKTINAAKFTHVFIYTFYLTLALNGFSLIGSLRYGIIFFLVFFIETIFLDLFMITVTAFTYFLILKFFDGEKLKDMINIVQIILVMGTTIIYQLVGRIIDVLDVQGTYIAKWWHYLIFPMWFAAPLEIIESHTINKSLTIFSILAFIVPIIFIIIYFKLSKSFERYLQKLNNNTYKSKDKVSVRFKLSKIICRNKQERAFFNFTCDNLKNEREFKLKVYPSLGMALFFPYLFMSKSLGDMFNDFSKWRYEMSNSRKFLFLYFTILILSTVVVMIKYSEKYKAAWIYKTAPVEEIASIFKGTFKGVMYRLILPIFLFQSLTFIGIFTAKVIPNLLVIFLVSILVSLISFKIMDKALPFSRSFKANESMGDIGPMIISIFLVSIFLGIHLAATLVWYGVYIYIGVLIILIMILWRKTFNISWSKIS